jgi:gliding motility-associated-like protein
VKEDLILPGGIVVYNLLSPDGDGKNDFLRIDGLQAGTDNTVEIFNRYGVKVFGTSNYNETDNVFRGLSDGRATVNRGEQLPTGTYFYILNYTYNSQRIKKAGYLYINGKN